MECTDLGTRLQQTRTDHTYVYARIMMVMGIANSLNGKYWTIPIVGKWAADWFKF